MKVYQVNETISLGFEDSCVGIDIPKVSQFHAHMLKAKEGDTVMLCGRLGNTDVMLATPNALNDIILCK